MTWSKNGLRKCLRYVENGVQIAVLVDPDDESVFTFRPGGLSVVLRGANWIALDEVLPGFELTVDELFASLRRISP